MTVEEFEQQLTQIGDDLQNSDNILLGIAGELVREMKQRAPVATGKLQSSISAFVNGGAIKFNMLYYGAYQNYGVKGIDANRAIPVEYGIDQRPREGQFFSFRDRQNPDRKYNYTRYGIAAKQFFNIEQMTEYIVREYENRIANNG